MFILIITVSCNQNKQVWTATYEQDLRKTIDDSIKPRITEAKKRSVFVEFVIKRLKSELPNGIESVPTETFNKVCVKIGKEYADLFVDPFNTGITPANLKWTTEVEQIIREGFLKGWGGKDLKKGNLLCDCAIAKLKIMDQDSVLMPVEKGVAFKIAKECNGSNGLKK